MSRRRKEENRGFAKLLDAWVAPADSGEPIGCIATSFTFQPEHFEEECLGRFLRLESDRNEDGPLYFIEFEEKASQLICASALIDQHNCRGNRSLRWDLLPIRPPGHSIQHAKVSLLCWSKLVRVIIASANLTEDGYRRNREVFGVIDCSDESQNSPESLSAVLAWLTELLTFTGDTTSAPVKRASQLLQHVRRRAADWPDEESRSDRSRVHVVPVITGPGRPNLFSQIGKAWPSQHPRRDAWVVSPFFDPPDSANRAATEIWSLLASSGDCHVRYCVDVEELPSGGLLAHVPRSVIESVPKGHRSATTSILRLSGAETARPLHMKAIWVESDTWAGYLMGSSNFTTAGTGCGKHPNFEANLLYLAHLSFCRDGFNSLNDGFPQTEEVALEEIKSWRVDPNQDETTDDGPIALPGGFKSASLGQGERGSLLVRLRFGETLPKNWRLIANEGDAGTSSFYDEARWLDAGRPTEVELPWSESLPPYGFTVFWHAARSGAWWPVNIESATVLPPPDELRNLPLETLLDILTSARPLHQAIAAWLIRRSEQPTEAKPLLDPHKRVDTTAFLLQRTRRVSWALAALRMRLARPVATAEGLHWRLYGPVGVHALATAISREARSDAERSFLLAELTMEIARVKPEQAPGCLGPGKVRSAMANAVKELRSHVEVTEQIPQNLRRYIAAVFGEATA